MGYISRWLDGKKTLLSGIGAILVTVGTFLTTGLSDGFQWSDLNALGAGLVAGLGLLGLGGKLQKLIDAIKK